MLTNLLWPMRGFVRKDFKARFRTFELITENNRARVIRDMTTANAEQDQDL